jgi:nicotinate phosphoribosyltransferase
MIYKLVEYAGEPALKLSTGKQTLVGSKQVWRRRDSNGRYAGDIIAARDEPAPGGGWEPLLRPVMRAGEILTDPSLDDLRERHRKEIEALPDELRDVTTAGAYPVEFSAELQRRQTSAEQTVREREGIAGG